MKQRGLVLLVCALAGFTTTMSSRGAVLYSFLSPVGAEITNQLDLISSGTGLPATYTRSLTLARNSLTRGGRVSLIYDLQALTAVSTLLTRGDLSDIFSPMLDTAVQSYADVVESSLLSTQARLNALPLSDDTLAAQRGLADVTFYLNRARNDTLASTSARLLSRAATRLTAVDALITRISLSLQDRVGRFGMSAFVSGGTFRSGSGGITASYDPALGAVTITASDDRITNVQTITLSVTGVRPAGTTSVSLGSVASGDYAIYTRQGTNTIGFTSVSGSALITVSLTRGIVSGTFSFVGSSRAGLDGAVQVSGGTFAAPLR